MAKFEAVLLFSPDLSNPIIAKEEESFILDIGNNDGNVVNKEEWGLRDLSFNIENYKKAFYKFYQIEIKGENIKNLKKILTQNEKILRHLFVNVNEHQELPTKLSIDNEEK